MFDQIKKLLQIEWLFEQPVESDKTASPSLSDNGTAPDFAAFVVPTPKVLTELHNLALRGNLRALISQTKVLQKEDTSLRPFAEKI